MQAEDARIFFRPGAKANALDAARDTHANRAPFVFPWLEARDHRAFPFALRRRSNPAVIYRANFLKLERRLVKSLC
jgi:hypothetical protein